MSDRVLIVLCTYNEIGNLPILLEQLHEALPSADVLVVDDNSPDGTGDWVIQKSMSDTNLFLLARAGKLGLGSATREAIAWCLDRNYDFMLQMDADLSHRPADAPKLLEACQVSEFDVAVGTRYAKGGAFHNIPLHRRLMSRALNRYATWLLQLPITDCSGSFRCYRTDALRKLDLTRLTCNGYGFLEELLVHLHREGCHMEDIPILFEPRNLGRSKLSFQDAIGAINVIRHLARHAQPRHRNPD